jgi:phosphoribosyl 1,2-cyclic phosphodiesterase
MLRLTSLASSSAGNATLVCTGNTKVLVDAGLPYKLAYKRLTEAGVNPESLTAILVTHEHGDHVKGLAALAQHQHLPVFIVGAVAEQVQWGWTNPQIIPIHAGDRFQVGEFRALAFPVPHDALEPVGFRLTAPDGSSATVATDLGEISNVVAPYLADTSILFIDSNHDTRMLSASQYHPKVKDRIGGGRGHLSNAQVSAFLRAAGPTLGKVVLAHLSGDNNSPELAQLEARHALGAHANRIGPVVAAKASILTVQA